MTLPTAQWRDIIADVCREYPPLPEDVYEAMILIESNGKPRARSPSDARGLSQILYVHHQRLVDETAERFGVPKGADALYDPKVALYAGGRHLRWLHSVDDEDKRSWERAIMAYHSGRHDPPENFSDGRGVTSDHHIAKLREALAGVRKSRNAGDDPAELEGELNGVPEQEQSMNMRAHQWPGARRSVYLPTWMPTPQVRIVDHRNVRSYQRFTGQTRVTRHDTGNPRTNAHGEYSWLAQGRPGGGAGGYNAIFDDKTLLITVPFNEVTWHAGTPDGNRSWGTELAFGGNVNWNQAFENGTALDGGLIEMQGLNPDNAIVLHQAWTQKFCSAQILNRNLWPTYKRKVAAYARAAAAARRGASVSVPSPARPGDVPSVAYADPSLPAVDGTPWDGSESFDAESGVRFVAQKGTVKTTVNLNRRQWASAESQQTGPMIPEGTDVNVLGWVKGELVDGISEWWVGDSGSRLWAGGIDAKPSDEPDWEALPAEKDYGLEIIGGRAYYPLLDDETGEIGREIEIWRDGDLHKWADTSTEKTGTVKAGETRTFKYWTRGEELPFVTHDGEETTELIWFARDLHSGDRMWAGLSGRPN